MFIVAAGDRTPGTYGTELRTVIEAIRYRWTLYRLQSAERAEQDSYRDAVKKARAERKPREEVDSLEQEAWEMSKIHEDAIYLHITNHLRQVSNRMFLPMPAMDDEAAWFRRTDYHRRVLSDAGIATVRSRIRREHKERSEVGLAWLAGATGVLGALTGLLAVYLSN
ncbi:MAG: hypothetical protein ABJF67_01465 [Aurantimonas coralicida]